MCVATYFILISLLTFYTTYIEKGIFVVALEKDPAGLDPDSKWEASSNLKKFDDIYDLTLVFRNGKTGATHDVTFHKSVADFFDENGLLCTDLLEDAVLKLHRDLGRKDD